LLGSTINLPVWVDRAGFHSTGAGGRAELGNQVKQLCEDYYLTVRATRSGRGPSVADNVWCVIDAIASVVAGLTKEPVALRYYVRALDNYSRDLANVRQ